MLKGQHLKHEAKILFVGAYPHPQTSLLARKTITLPKIHVFHKLLKSYNFWARLIYPSSIPYFSTSKPPRKCKYCFLKFQDV